MTYQLQQVESVCKLVTSGGTPLSSNPSFYEPKEISWLKTAEVNYCRIYDTENYISEEGLRRSSAKLIPVNSVIVAMYGQGDTAGRVAINKIPLSTNQACCNLVIDDKKADYRFVYYALATLYEKMVSLKNGGAQPNLNAGIIKAIEIPMPTLHIQKRIADILSTYDDLIENNQKQIKLLEEAAQRLYKEWFVDFRFPGYEKVEIIDGVPKGWEKNPLGKMLKVVRGRSYASKELSDNEGLLMVNLSNIRPYGGYNRDQEKHYTGKVNKDQFVEKHDLLMGVTDMTQERRTVGRVAIVPNLHAKAMISMDLIKLVPIEGSPLFYYALLNFGGYSEAISRFANGTNVLHLRPEVLDIVDAVIPDISLQNRFVEFYESIQNRMDALQDEMIIAAEARDRLLPKLMSGEEEV